MSCSNRRSHGHVQLNLIKHTLAFSGRDRVVRSCRRASLAQVPVLPCHDCRNRLDRAGAVRGVSPPRNIARPVGSAVIDGRDSGGRLGVMERASHGSYCGSLGRKRCSPRSPCNAGDRVRHGLRRYCGVAARLSLWLAASRWIARRDRRRGPGCGNWPTALAEVVGASARQPGGSIPKSRIVSSGR